MCHSNDDTKCDISVNPIAVDDEAVTAESAVVNDKAVTTDAVTTINYSLPIMSLCLPKQEQSDIPSDIAELIERIKKANETMDSLLNNHLVTMAPSPIKNQYFNDVFANISQP